MNLMLSEVKEYVNDSDCKYENVAEWLTKGDQVMVVGIPDQRCLEMWVQLMVHESMQVGGTM